MVVDKYENEHNNFIEHITPNHYIGRKTDNEILEKIC